MKRRLAILTAVALLAWHPPAAAQVDATRQDELTRIYTTAQEDFLAKRYTEALPRFEQVARELGSPNAQLYVARCLRELGRRVEARTAMKRTAEMAAAHPERNKFEPTRVAAETELGEIEMALGRVSVSVERAPAGLRLEVAGQPVAVGEVVFVEPGRVRVDALAPGRDLQRQEIVVASGVLEWVAFQYAATSSLPPVGPGAQPTLPPIDPQPPQPPQPPAPGEPDERGWTEDGTIRILGIVAAGIGVAGWVTFLVAGLKADALYYELEDECGVTCGPAQDEQIDTGRDLDLIANIGLGVGIAGTVAGVLMIALGGPSDTAPIQGSRAGQRQPWIVGASADGGFIGYRVQF